MKRAATIALVLLAIGCNKKAAPPRSAPQSATDRELGALPSIPVSNADSEVVVTLGSHTLTRAQMEKDLAIRIQSAGGRLPPGQANAIYAQLTGKLIEQFVIQSLLLDEATRAKIEVFPEDEQRALDRIGEYLKTQGKTLEEALEGSPMGRDRMLSEIRTGVTIDKLLASRLPKLAEPTDAEISKFIEENKDHLQRPERVHARRLLLAVNPEADEAARTIRKDEALQLRESLVKGTPFDDVAREHSDCPSSARGGDLGWIPAGKMEPEFDQAAFNQATGEVGPVVESPLGYQIIRVEAHEPAQPVSREEIIERLKQLSRQKELKQLVDSLLAQTPAEYAPSVANLVPDTVRR